MNSSTAHTRKAVPFQFSSFLSFLHESCLLLVYFMVSYLKLYFCMDKMRKKYQIMCVPYWKYPHNSHTSRLRRKLCTLIPILISVILHRSFHPIRKKKCYKLQCYKLSALHNKCCFSCLSRMLLLRWVIETYLVLMTV